QPSSPATSTGRTWSSTSISSCCSAPPMPTDWLSGRTYSAGEHATSRSSPCWPARRNTFAESRETFPQPRAFGFDPWLFIALFPFWCLHYPVAVGRESVLHQGGCMIFTKASGDTFIASVLLGMAGLIAVLSAQPFAGGWNDGS